MIPLIVKAAKAVADIALEHLEQEAKPKVPPEELCRCGHARSKHCGCGEGCMEMVEQPSGDRSRCGCHESGGYAKP